MARFPEVQKKAQAQLDAVVGPDRLPDFDDRAALPYVDAILREALRWMPMLPFGFAHCTDEDDELGGFFVPANTMVLPNVWYRHIHASCLSWGLTGCA